MWWKRSKLFIKVIENLVGCLLCHLPLFDRVFCPSRKWDESKNRRSNALWKGRVICGLMVGIVVLTMAIRLAYAQTDPVAWSVPQVVVQSNEASIGRWTALVSDSTGRLHLFFSLKPGQGDSRSINYTYWNGSYWSNPVDIISNEAISGFRVTIDSLQVIHLVWVGSGNSLLYSSAPIAQAGQARAWTHSLVLATSLPEMDITTDPDDVLYVAYADFPATDTVSLIQSVDGGMSWSHPVVVAEVGGPDTAPNEVRVAVDEVGRLHVVWTEYRLPNGWPPLGAFYARSEDQGAHWSEPLQVAGLDHGQLGVGAFGDGEIHLVWRSVIGGDGTFHQVSEDGGMTWTLPERSDDGGGFSGLPSFAVDTVGRVHYVIGRTFYAMWDGQALSPYEDLRTVDVLAQATMSFGEHAVLAILGGNQVHVVFETDFGTLWHSYKNLSVPPLPTVLPSPVALPSTEVGDANEPVAVSTTIPTRQVWSEGEREPDVGSRLTGEWVIVLSILPALVIVLVVVATKASRRG